MILSRKRGPVSNSYWATWFLLMFFKAIGFGTFSLNTIKWKQKKGYSLNFTYSRFGILYNILLIILLIAIDCSFISFGKYELNIGAEYIVFQTIIGSILNCLILLSYCRNQMLLVSIGNQLVNIEKELQHLLPPNERQRIFWNILLGCIMKILLCAITVSLETMSFPVTLSTAVTFISTSIVGWYVMEYYCFVSLLEALFVDVNHGIQNLARKSYTNHHSISSCSWSPIIVNGSILRTLGQLRDIHDSLCEISMKMADFFSMHVLFCTGFLFFTMVYNAYYTVLFINMSNSTLRILRMVDSIGWVLWASCPIVLLSMKSTRVVLEVQNTGRIVYAFLMNTVDRVLKSQLKEFSLQLLHRDIKFTAYGFFPLDNTLLHSIIAAGSTYLVLVMQLHDHEEPTPLTTPSSVTN